MKGFIYYAPTQVVFRRYRKDKTGEIGGNNMAVLKSWYIMADKSAEHFRFNRCAPAGRLEAEGIAYVKLGGVVPNPRLSKVHEGIELCRKEKVDFILAVGGGSVIDSAKAVLSVYLMRVKSGIHIWDEPMRKLVCRLLPC